MMANKSINQTPIFKLLRSLRKVGRRIKGGNGPFRIIYLDPPWQFSNWSTNELTKYDLDWCRRMGRSPYPVMKQKDLFDIPVWELAAKDSLMLMWATWAKLLDAIELMYHYGFEYRTTAFVWIKQNPSTVGYHKGMGYYTMKNSEFVLLGRRGRGVKRVNRDVSELIFHPRGRHSAKPPKVRNRIDHLFGDVMRCELFARNQPESWYVWGNEVPKIEIFNPINHFIAPPIEVLLDDDEAQGLGIIDTKTVYHEGDQIHLPI